MGTWKWYAYGKHPVAADFIQAGRESPLAAHFRWWVEKGYQASMAKGYSPSSFNSWRFWAQGSKADELVLGLVRDSGDSRGRPFPILFLGCGGLQSWIAAWELLPLVCEPVWAQVEQLTVKRLGSLEEFKHELTAVRPPTPEWASAQRAYALALRSMENEQVHQGTLAGRTEDQALSYEIPLQDHNASAMLLVSCHKHLKSHAWPAPPQSVFMGGSSSILHVMSFYRSIAVSDYINLWSLR